MRAAFVGFGIPLALLAAVVAFIAALTLIFPTQSFDAMVGACRNADSDARFSCYRVAIERKFGTDIQAFAEFMSANKVELHKVLAQGTDEDYAVFGTNCHTFYHAAGDFVGTFGTGSLKTLLDYGPTDCTNGYTMGVYKRVALANGYDTDTLGQFYTVCKKGAENQCAHEVGHALHDKYTYALLKVVDEISKHDYGLSYPKTYMYVSSTASNLDEAFEECDALLPNENLRAQCYTGIGHNMFVFGEFDPEGFKKIFETCASTTPENRDNCNAFLLYRIGINNAAPYFLRDQAAEGNAVCTHASGDIDRDDLLKHCYLGLGGGLGLFIDSEYSLDDIAEQDLARTKGELLRYARMCNGAGDFADTCIAGLLGTKFAKFYAQLGMYDEHIERVRDSLTSVFEIVG